MFCFGRFCLRPDERVLLVAGQPAPLGARAFDMLTLLVQERHRVVGKEELLRAVWPGRVVEENNLQVHVSALRKLLGPQALSTVAGHGYRFTLRVDGDPDAPPAVQSLAGDVPAAPAAQGGVQCWPGLEIRADERRVLVHGQPTQLSPRTMALLSALVERAQRAVSKSELMDLLWPGVATSDNNLQAHIAGLRKVLGPGAIVTVPGQGYQFNAGPPVSRPRAAPPAPGPRPPLAPRSPLLGRDGELGSLAAALRNTGVVTVCGPGGMGKTRLAQALVQTEQADGAQWPDGVHWVDLAGVADAALLAPLVARTLRVALPGRRPAADELAGLLAPLRLLLVLDNCEHLQDAPGRLVQQLLAPAGGVHVLATSREPLHVAGEHVLRLQPLALPAAPQLQDLAQAGQCAAVQLFAERAYRATGRVVLAADSVAAVGEICVHLDGLPLAIELAAARVPLLGVHGVRDKLGEVLRLLGGGAAHLDRRHRTLAAAFDWSYALLSSTEQAVYRRLSVFAGGFTPALAQRMLAAATPGGGLDAWDVLDHLGALVDKSLVNTDGADPPRCHLLETARAHARQQLQACGETATAQTRHALALRTLFDESLAARERGELSDYAFVDLLAPELDNARAALAHARATADIDTAAVLADACAATLTSQGRMGEALPMLLELEPLVQAQAAPSIAARLWLRLGRCGGNGRLPDEHCIRWMRRATLEFARLGLARDQHSGLFMTAETLIDSGQPQDAVALLDEARALEQQAPDWSAIYTLRRLRVQWLVHKLGGQVQAALDMLSAAIELALEAGIERNELTLRADRGKYLVDLGRFDEAVSGLRLVLLRARTRAADRGNLADVLGSLAVCEAQRGQHDAALQCLVEMAALWRRSGLLPSRGGLVAWVLARLGHPLLAGQWLGAAEHHLQRLGNRKREPRFLQAQQMLQAAHAPGEVQLWMAEGAALKLSALMAQLSAVTSTMAAGAQATASGRQGPLRAQ